MLRQFLSTKLTNFSGMLQYLPTVSSASAPKHVKFPSTTQTDCAWAIYAKHWRPHPRAFSQPNSLNSLTPPTTSPSP